MTDDTNTRLLGALNDLLVEVVRLRADVAALGRGSQIRPIDDGTLPATRPQEQPFSDHWTDRPHNPDAYHPDLRAHSGTYLKTLADPLARRVAGVPEALFLQWRDPPGWYATDAQDAEYRRQHSLPAAGAPDGSGTAVGPT